MINNIAKLCEISKEQINIKGKTTEKLGVVGRKAIAWGNYFGYKLS